MTEVKEKDYRRYYRIVDNTERYTKEGFKLINLLRKEKIIPADAVSTEKLGSVISYIRRRKENPKGSWHNK